MRVDLHIHSTASDGCWPSEELVAHVLEAGIELFAVADHDTAENVLAVERHARDSGLHYLRAVEISSTLNGRQFHLLGYGIDPANPALLCLLGENWSKLNSVDDQSIHKLVQAGCEIQWEDYERYQYDRRRGGWKALNYLIDVGICRDVQDFFGRLFVADMALTYPAFASPEQVVQVIRGAGGRAICAHPGQSISEGDLGLLQDLLDRGVEGLECYSPYHDGPKTRFFLDLCRRNDLLITAGSDCHGGFAGRVLGVPEVQASDLRLGPLLDHVIR